MFFTRSQPRCITQALTSNALLTQADIGVAAGTSARSALPLGASCSVNTCQLLAVAVAILGVLILISQAAVVTISTELVPVIRVLVADISTSVPFCIWKVSMSVKVNE